MINDNFKQSALFLEVDVQLDFIEGSLKVDQANYTDRLENMLRLSKAAPLLVGSVDSHDFSAWEFNTNDNVGPNKEKPNFPPHCVVGTKGWLRAAYADRADAVFVPNTALLTSDMDTWLERLDDGTTFFFMKEVYSLFANPNAKLFLDLISRRVVTDQVVVYGIATDYCVKAAVENLITECYDVTVVKDAIAAVDPSTEEGLLARWKELGASISTTQEVMDTFETKEEK